MADTITFGELKKHIEVRLTRQRRPGTYAESVQIRLDADAEVVRLMGLAST